MSVQSEAEWGQGPEPAKAIEKRAKELGNIPALPCTSDQFALGDKGLTKREWLVGMALQGFLSTGQNIHENTPATLADWAMIQADATLIELAESEVRND